MTESAVIVLFVGGPADGTELAVPGTNMTGPAHRYTIETPDGPFDYRRQPNQLESGPLWCYVPAEANDG